MLHWVSSFVDSGEHRTRPPSVQMDNRTRRRRSPNRLFAPPTLRLSPLYRPYGCHRPHHLQRRRHPVRSRQSDALGTQWAPGVRMEKLAVPGRQRWVSHHDHCRCLCRARESPQRCHRLQAIDNSGLLDSSPDPFRGAMRRIGLVVVLSDQPQDRKGARVDDLSFNPRPSRRDHPSSEPTVGPATFITTVSGGILAEGRQ